MYTSSVFLMLISTSLIAVIYSSSTSFVFAVTSCITVGNTAVCASDDPVVGGMWKCEYQKDETWKCEKAKASANIPPGLTDALEDVTAEKVPSNGKILSENEDTGENEAGDNMTFSRANISALH